MIKEGGHMNYDKDNKIWRVLGPLFAFLGVGENEEILCGFAGIGNDVQRCIGFCDDRICV